MPGVAQPRPTNGTLPTPMVISPACQFPDTNSIAPSAQLDSGV